MEIRETREYIVIMPLSPILDLRESRRLFSEINLASKKVAFDMSLVNSCTIDFINIIKEYTKHNDINFFNINSDLFVLFNIMKIDKLAKLFVSELDFVENSRQLINRTFSILKSA